MRCKLAVNLDTDLPYWVEVSSFHTFFNQHDYNFYREVQDVSDAYLEDWFHTDLDGKLFFILPPVGVRGGITEFISGRHRTAVLMKHLSKVPLSFDSRFLSAADKEWIDSVVDHPIDLDAEVELPDLPVKLTLP